VKKDGDRGANSIPTKQRQNMHALWDQLLGQDFALRTTRRRYAEIVRHSLLVDTPHLDRSLNPTLEQTAGRPRTSWIPTPMQ
jgi:hypothetical protein